MKNITKLIWLITLTAIIAFGVAACGNLFNKDDDNDDNNNDSTSKKSTPVYGDFNISGTGTFDFDYKLRKVTVAAKPNKTTGAVTVYYTGTGGTKYEKNDSEPLFKGTYSVTFDVAEAEGWNEAKGLYAGAIIISDGTPAAPTGLSASIASETSIKLNWSSVSKATSYYVHYMSEDDTELTKTAVLGTTTYTHTADPDKNYWFYVTAVNSLGESEYSAVKAIATKMPVAPNEVSPITTSASAITVRWSAVDGASTYKVYRDTDQAGSNKTELTTSAASNSFSATGLTANTTYYFWVKAVNAFGESDFSPAGSAKTWESGGTSTWTANLRAEVLSGNLIWLNWREVSGASRYRVYYTTGSPSNAKGAIAASINQTIFEAQPNTTYYFWVVYITGFTNESGYSEMVVIGSGSPPPPPPPTPPSSALSTPPAGGGEGQRVCTNCLGIKGCCINGRPPWYDCYYTGYINCLKCDGNGDIKGVICSKCKGSKKEECGTCNGTGKCFRCGGTGLK